MSLIPRAHCFLVACAGDSAKSTRLRVSWPLKPQPTHSRVPHARSRFALANRYEVEVVAVAGSSMGLYLMMACICCTVFGGRSMRARHHSRWFTNRQWRVQGAIPYAAEESRREGEFYDHLAKGQLPARAHELQVGSTFPGETAAHTAFTSSLARKLFATSPDAMGASAPADTVASACVGAPAAGSFTFASLLGGGGDDAPRSPHRLRL